MSAVKKTLFLFFLILAVCAESLTSPAAASPAPRQTRLSLNAAEQAFIREHPVIRLSVDPAFVPYEFFDTDGVYKGIAADYIDAVCELTGLRMLPEEGLTWAEAYGKAVNRENDVLPCVSMTQQRQSYFLFSEPYFTFQRAIYVKTDNTAIRSIEDIYDRTVAVQANSSHENYLKANYPSVKLSRYPTVEQALAALSNDRETSFVGNLATTSYLIKKLGITNLKYITIDSRDNQSLYFAVRNDWPVLVGIINKALAAMTSEEKIAIRNKWLGVPAEADYSEIIRTAGIIGGIVLLVLVVSVFWILRLRREIARRKKAEEELRAAKEDAERANQVKSLFLARMSHEVRTPLHTITGMSHLFGKTDMTATQAGYLDKIVQAARHMLGIINDILDFSKIEAGKISLEKVSFDLDGVLQRVLNIESLKVDEQGIALFLEKAPDLPRWFLGDPVRVEQILLNIVSNAVKFTKKGAVTLSVGLAARAGALCTVVLTVRDTGIGMSREQLDRLFVPFDQGDSSITRRFGGTGLGMSIVKNLVELMGGTIDVTSVPGEGSEFTVRLPLPADADGAEHREPPPENSNAGRSASAQAYSLLLVEDNRTNQFIARTILEQVGFRVLAADGGGDAVRLFRNNPGRVDLILMDLQMPDMDGYAASDLIRQLDGDVPIVAMTADAIAGVSEQCRRHGMAYYVSKPFEPDALIETILRILQDNPVKEPPAPRPPAEEMLPAVLDRQDGLRRLGGDREIYGLVLREFLNENLETGERLMNAVSARQYEAAVQLVHKTKSSAGNIGAKTLYEAASALQHALAAGDEAALPAHLSTFTRLLSQVLGVITQLPGLPAI